MAPMWNSFAVRMAGRLRRGNGLRFSRFAGASILALLASSTTLAICDGLLHLPSLAAAVLSWLAGTVVSYVLTRWAWERRGRPDVLRETLPFLGISVIVIVVVGLATKLGYAIAADLSLRGAEHVAVVECVFVAANFGTFLARFAIFHRLLFRTRGPVTTYCELTVTYCGLGFCGMNGRTREPVPTNVASIAAADTVMAPRLERLAGASNYTDWIFEHVEPHLGSEVLEIGAGHGTFTELLSARADRVVATDVAERCVDLLRERFARDERVTVVEGSTETLAGTARFDSAVLINVLEHIKDDDGALLDLASALRPGGRLVLWVPAFNLLYSDWDRQVGHYRRYRKGPLGAQLTRAGYEVTEIRYVNSAGALAWLVLARMMHKIPSSQGRVSFFNSYCVPVLRRLEKKRGAPFGQSVLAVATWPG